jgi:ubiquinone/menaquinone biosynthesis C-methylase UbiE
MIKSCKEKYTDHKSCMHKHFFNQRAEQWDTITKHDTTKIEYILSLLELKGSEKILDVGTGTGILIPFYLKYLTSGTITACDFSEKMIDVALSKFPTQTYPQIKLIISDVYDITYSSMFDIVMCYSCFPHFKDKALALSILKKTLKHSGRLVIAHSNSREEINTVHMVSGDEISQDMLSSLCVLKKIINDVGLKVIFERDDKDFFILIAKKE